MLSSRRRSTATGPKFRVGELGARVLLLQRLDRFPVEVEFPGHFLDGGLATVPPHVVRKALGMEGVVRHEVEQLALDVAATLVQHAPQLDPRNAYASRSCLRLFAELAIQTRFQVGPPCEMPER